MNKIDSLNQVAEFHNTFGAPILETPQIPSKQRCELRVSLLQEELDELREAIENNDIVEVADALADLQYVLSGAILEFGLGNKFDKIFDEVHRSNMSKACKTEDEANDTVNHYLNKGVEADYEESKIKEILRVNTEGVSVESELIKVASFLKEQYALLKAE